MLENKQLMIFIPSDFLETSINTTNALLYQPSKGINFVSNKIIQDMFRPFYLLFILFFFSGCSKLLDSVTPASEPIKISQFERAGYSDLLIDKSGNYHAVFLESADFGKPVFVYYTSSTNKGKSWSKPINISNDLSGNGSGYPRIIQDGNSTIYAIWKRYGKTGGTYPIAETLLEGTGGYTIGTLFFATINGGAASKPMPLAESEMSQISWFPAVDRNGKVRVFWSQISNESLKNGWNSWYYADWIREAELTSSGMTNIQNYTTPSKPDYAGGAPPQYGWQNLRGYFDAQNKPHFLWETLLNKQKTIAYFGGTKVQTIYQYPLYKEGNTFNNPAALLVDDLGNEHIIFMPSAATLDSEQIWDYNVNTQKTTILASIQKKGVNIQSYQGYQGPNGEMAVTIQVGGLVDSNESYGFFYKNGTWTITGLTQNSNKETFNSTEFKSFNNKSSYLSQLTLYNTKFIKIAWDNSGKKSMLMTLSADWIGGGFRTDSPSVMFENID